jgi:hypothetical protein
VVQVDVKKISLNVNASIIFGCRERLYKQDKLNHLDYRRITITISVSPSTFDSPSPPTSTVHVIIYC